MDHLEITYDWLVKVLKRQGHWLSNDDLWTAFPYKKNVLRLEFDTVIKHMQKEAPKFIQP